MKSAFRIICLVSILTLTTFNNSWSQTKTSNALGINAKIPSQMIISLDENSKIKIQNLSHEELYSKGEDIRGFFAKTSSNPPTKNKIYSEKLNHNETSINLYYQNSRVYVIVHRIVNTIGDMLFNKVFYFDDHNNCISCSEWSDKTKMTYTNAMYWDSLVRFDVDYNRIEIDPAQKQQIIQSSKLSLDSLMRHFPEFKYSLNWK